MRFNQTGAFHLVILIVLALAVVAGVYLASRPAIFKSQADNHSKLEISSAFYNDGKSTSKFVLVLPTYGGEGSPEFFRLSNNQTELDRGTVFVYVPPGQPRNPSLWNLDVSAIDNEGQIEGKRTIFGQFLVDGKWTTPISVDIQLEKTNNSIGLRAACDTDSFKGFGPYPVKIKWNPESIENADSLVLMMFNGKGGYLSDAGPIDFGQGETTLYIPSIANSYSIFTTILNDDNVAGTSEFSFSCTEPDSSSYLGGTGLDVECDEYSCKFNWANKGKPTQLVELSPVLVDPVTLSEVIPVNWVGRDEKTISIYINGYSLINGMYSGFVLNGLVLADDPEAAALSKKSYLNKSPFDVTGIGTGIVITEPSCSGSSCDIQPNFPTDGTPYCQVKVSDVNGSIKRVDYAGINGPVRLAIATKDLVTDIPGERISIDGKPTIRNYALNFEPYGDVYSYVLDTCDGTGAKGCSGSIKELDLPVGEYNVYCDVIQSETTSCSGYPGCKNEGGNIDCMAKWNRNSCSTQDQINLSVNSKGVCRQVLSQAKNIKTGQCKQFSTPCDIPAGWVEDRSCSSTSSNPGQSPATIIFPQPNNTGIQVSCAANKRQLVVSGKSNGDLLRFGKYNNYPSTGNPGKDAQNATGDYIGNAQTTKWTDNESVTYSLEGNEISGIDTYWVERGYINNGEYLVRSYVNVKCQ